MDNLCSCIRWILFGYSEEEIGGVCRERLNDWKVEMYANNTYLHTIPNEAVKRKREEIMKDLKTR